MARQAGPLFFTGTIDSLTFYKMDGVYLARKKSSLDRKRFRTDPRFTRSRKSAAAFGEASKLASQIYWQLPKNQRGKGVVNKLTGQVGQLLKEGKTAEDILLHFQQQYHPAVANPVAQSHAKQITALPPHPSAWKVTPAGKLITPQFIPMVPFHVKSAFSTAVILNRYRVAQLE